MTLEDRLLGAGRATLLRFLSQLVNELTIRARFHYEEDDSHAALVETNEAIHYVSGHLRDLINPEVTMTPSRAAALASLAGLLERRQLEGLTAWAQL